MRTQTNSSRSPDFTHSGTEVSCKEKLKGEVTKFPLLLAMIADNNSCNTGPQTVPTQGQDMDVCCKSLSKSVYTVEDTLCGFLQAKYVVAYYMVGQTMMRTTDLGLNKLVDLLKAFF